MKIRVEIEGARELDAALAQLPAATGKAVMRRALTKAARLTASRARAYAPVETGNLRESITITPRLNRRQSRGQPKAGDVAIYVGPAVGKGAKGSHGHLLEFGTYKMAARPFMRPAWESTKDQVLRTIQAELWAELRKAARRLARKAAAGKLSKSAFRTLGG